MTDPSRAPSSGVLTSRHQDGVLTLTLNRPEAFNAFNTELKQALLAGLRAADQDPTVRAVVLTGAGRAFCAGQDLKEHLGRVIAQDPGLADTVAEFYNPLARLITSIRKPILTAINGVAAGAGAAMAFASDLRVAGESASFTMAFAGAGLCADTGASFTLPRLIGTGKTLELMLTGERVGSAEALRLGMVSQVVPDAELADTVQRLAATLAAGPTAAFGWIKASVHAAAAGDLDAALAYEDRAQQACFHSADHAEGMRAFVEKRPAAFTGN